MRVRWVAPENVGKNGASSKTAEAGNMRTQL